MKKFLAFFLILFFLIPTVFAGELLQTSTGFYYPVNKKHSGAYLHFGSKNRYYGMSCHLANDYKVPENTPVYAVGIGVVESVNDAVGNYGGDSPARSGGAIIIKHFSKNGEVFYALYGHMKNFQIKKGESVKGGQYLGDVAMYYSGTTPLSHLHFGINKEFPTYLGYTPTRKCENFMGFVNPEKFLKSHSPFNAEKEIKKFLEKMKILQKQILSIFGL